MEQITTPMVYYRSGTSKAVFIDQRDLPVKEEKDLTAWILAIYGSPDPWHLAHSTPRGEP